MATIRQVYTLEYIASMFGEDPEMLEAIVSNEDNLTCGSILTVCTGPDKIITALTDDGVVELGEMIATPAAHPMSGSCSSIASSITPTSSIASRRKLCGNNRAVTR